MSDFPLAYHITFAMYGTRLPGDERGCVDRSRNKPGDPFIGEDAQWETVKRSMLNHDPVYLSHEQRVFGEKIIPDICKRGDWTYHIAACQDNHVHVMLSTSSDGKAVRKWFKRWLGEALSERWTMPQWFAVGGSVRWVWDDWYLENLYRYIKDQRTTKE